MVGDDTTSRYLVDRPTTSRNPLFDVCATATSYRRSGEGRSFVKHPLEYVDIVDGMGDRNAKNALFDGFAEVAKALANGRRGELIDVLVQGERRVDDLAAEIDQSVANTSFHLRALATTGLVTSRREGTRVYYRLASERVLDLWLALRDVAEAHLENLNDLAIAYLGDRASLDSIGRDELTERLQDGGLVLLDVRNETEFNAGHITGATSIPLTELQSRIDELPESTDIVAYCRGTYCLYADDAVRLLNAMGRTAIRLEGGFPEWRSEDRETTDGDA